MKHTKIFFALLALAVAVLAFGCKQANSAFTMNTQQQVAYDSMITAFEAAASMVEYPAASVKTALDANNLAFSALNFKVTDKEVGKPIAQGTNADTLKKRFVPSAL